MAGSTQRLPATDHQVGELVRVVAEVVELLVVAVDVVDELPALGDHGVEVRQPGVPRALDDGLGELLDRREGLLLQRDQAAAEEQVLTGERRLTGVEEREEGQAVDPFGRRDVGHVRDGRRQVDVAGQLADVGAGLDARPAHQQRDADGLLELVVLGDVEPVLAHVVAVVRGEHDVGVVERALCLEAPHECSDVRVEDLDGPDPLPEGLVDVVDLLGGHPAADAAQAVLVADVLLVEARRSRVADVPELGVERSGAG